MDKNNLQHRIIAVPISQFNVPVLIKRIRAANQG